MRFHFSAWIESVWLLLGVAVFFVAIGNRQVHKWKRWCCQNSPSVWDDSMTRTYHQVWSDFHDRFLLGTWHKKMISYLRNKMVVFLLVTCRMNIIENLIQHSCFEVASHQFFYLVKMLWLFRYFEYLLKIDFFT